MYQDIRLEMEYAPRLEFCGCVCHRVGYAHKLIFAFSHVGGVSHASLPRRRIPEYAEKYEFLATLGKVRPQKNKGLFGIFLFFPNGGNPPFGNNSFNKIKMGDFFKNLVCFLVDLWVIYGCFKG